MNLITRSHVALLIAVVVLSTSCRTATVRAAEGGADDRTRNVVLVTLDGLRWQEVFGGAQEKYIDQRAGGVRDLAGVRHRYLRATPEASREALMPFLWSTIARQGQIFGDVSRNSPAVSRNGKKFSYPGYSELLCGFPDDRINSNDRIPNPNVSVLE